MFPLLNPHSIPLLEQKLLRLALRLAHLVARIGHFFEETRSANRWDRVKELHGGITHLLMLLPLVLFRH